MWDTFEMTVINKFISSWKFQERTRANSQNYPTGSKMGGNFVLRRLVLATVNVWYYFSKEKVN